MRRSKNTFLGTFTRASLPLFPGVELTCGSSNDNAQASGKKTIAPQDVIAALKDAELESFLPRLEAELKSMFPSAAIRRSWS